VITHDRSWTLDDRLTIRASDPSDLPFIEEMLFEAFFWDDRIERPELSRFRAQPEFAKMFAGWGRAGDRALIAMTPGGERVGAAWFRLWTPEVHSYGFVSPDIPELGIAVVRKHRSEGVGRALLRALIDTAQSDAYTALSLSVSPDNRARALYESERFRRVGQSGTSWTLLRDLAIMRHTGPV
jgi:ribosomal protein S18 acetylase RimI-like enzyme